MSNRKTLLSCTVVSVQDYGFVYPSCEFCVSRLIQENQNRSRCPKCGFTCDIKNVDYRYRLSLKVLRDTNIFGVTVFGGCLNPFFGIAAGGLHRFLESEITEGPHTLQQLLSRAVEDCFIGKCFIFGFTHSGRDTGSILRGEHSSALPDVQFVACQIIPIHGASLGLTVFSYMQKLLQACIDSGCSSDPINQSQQKDSLVTSFSHTLPLCMSLHSQPSSEGLTHPWNEISDLDLCFSLREMSECSSPQPSLHNVKSIVSQYATQSGPKNETLLVLEAKEDTDSVQSTEICTVKPYGSKGWGEIRCSTLQESSMTANLKLSPFEPGTNVYFDQNNFSLADAPLSESLGGFISHNVLSPISNNNLCKRDQVLSYRKKLDNDPMFTPLSDITNAKRDKNVKNSQKQEYTKQKNLSKAHVLAALTPSRTSSSIKQVANKDLWFQNLTMYCNKPTIGKAYEESLLESHEDGYNCSSDLFQQSSLDVTDLGVAEAVISTTQQEKKDFVTERRSFNFAPTLQSTPICNHNHARKQWGKRSRSQCSRKKMTTVTKNRDLQKNLDITQITEKMRAEVNQTPVSAFENYESSAGGFVEPNKHLQEENTVFNDYSRDLFDHSSNDFWMNSSF